MGEEWELVESKSERCIRKLKSKAERLSDSTNINLLDNRFHEFAPSTCSLFRKIVSELEDINFIPSSIIGLGIGNFLESPCAMLQFEVFKSLVGHFCIKNSQVTIYDPSMTTNCLNVCQQIGFNVPMENVFGRFHVEPLSLIFMPHCPYQLYNNILWQNWKNLGNMCIVGNRYVEIIYFIHCCQLRSLSNAKPGISHRLLINPASNCM